MPSPGSGYGLPSGPKSLQQDIDAAIADLFGDPASSATAIRGGAAGPDMPVVDPMSHYDASAAGDSRRSNPFGGVVFSGDPSPVGDKGFGNSLLDAWMGAKQIRTDRDTERQRADRERADAQRGWRNQLEQWRFENQGRGGGGGGYSPYPDLYRWSPQGRPVPGVPGTAAPGTSPIRRPGAPIEPPEPDWGPDTYRDPHPGADPEGMLAALRRVTLVPGQQPMDLSDPDKIAMPGVNMGMLPSPYTAYGRGADTWFDRSLAMGSSGGGPYHRPPGAPISWAPAPGNEAADYEWFTNTSQQYKDWITQNRPEQRRMHPLEAQFRQFGITPDLLARARVMRGAGRL